MRLVDVTTAENKEPAMRIGIGLPSPVPGVPGGRLLEWARRSEERGFAALATIDRVAYPNHDSLVSLAAAAAATTRIGVMTNILRDRLGSGLDDGRRNSRDGGADGREGAERVARRGQGR
jgi:hypothetical protein